MRAWKSSIGERAELLDKVACVMMTSRDVFKDDPVFLGRWNQQCTPHGVSLFLLIFIKIENKVHKSMAKVVSVY